jgi:hypothetical protein
MKEPGVLDPLASDTMKKILLMRHHPVRRCMQACGWKKKKKKERERKKNVASCNGIRELG